MCLKNRIPESVLDASAASARFSSSVPPLSTLGAVHILRNLGWGGGSSRFITILHRGGLPNLLQFYLGGGFYIQLQYYSF